MNIWEWAGVTLAVVIVWHSTKWILGYLSARAIARGIRRIQR